MVDLEKTAAILCADLSLAQERSSEVDELREEWVKLITQCGELEEEVHWEVTRVCKVPPEVVKKIKEDYLASDKFQEEKFECAMDGHSRGFNECVRQVQKLDPNFDVTRLKEDLKEEESEGIDNVGE